MMQKVFLLLCLLAASGCKFFPKTTQYRIEDGFVKPKPKHVLHYKRTYSPFRDEFIYKPVYTLDGHTPITDDEYRINRREQRIKRQVDYYDKCIAGEEPHNLSSTIRVLSYTSWSYLLEGLPNYQVEWLIDQCHKEVMSETKKATTPLRKRRIDKYVNFKNRLSETLKERNQKEIRTSSLQRLCASPDSDVNQVRSVLSLGCDVNAMNEDGYPPLHLAAVTNKNGELITVLLEAGADVTKKCQGGLTALQHAAAENKNPEVFAALLEAGSDVNAKFEGGTTPLHSVVSFNPSVEIVQLLLMYGADVNEMDQQFGITPLHAASAFGTNPEVISVLLYAGANPNLCNKKGQLPLDMARDNDALQGTEALDELTEATSK